jgi:hypothetical protein
MKTKMPVALVALALGLQLACSSEYPEPFVGDIRGTVTYHGTAAGELANPVLIVGAFAYRPDFPQLILAGSRPMPHAAFCAPNPSFGPTGIPYRLKDLEPFDKGYFVTAIIADVMDPTVGSAGLVATGVYPDLDLIYGTPAEGPVKIVVAHTVEDVDVEMQDIQQ